MPDYEYVSREMQKSGVTLNLLWLEYCEQCSNNGETPYTPDRLENACKRALSFTPRPSYKNIQIILSSGQDKQEDPAVSSASSNGEQYGFTRGDSYYGGVK